MNFEKIDIEKHYKSKYKFVAGVDEAGRGALAGPVSAAAVILPNDDSLDNFGITDSKKINEKKRNELFDVIMQKAIAVSVAFVHNDEIDKINILKATIKAMNQAIDNLSTKPDFLLIDGNYFNGSAIKHQTVVKGDLICPTISAASIIAKVSRDRWMKDVASKEYPEYNFDVHKGYAVKKHYEVIDNIDICCYHRITFLNKRYNDIANQLFK